MAATGFTPVYLYYSSTASNVPLAANLGYGELAINITDGYLYYKDNVNAVQKIGYKLVPTTNGGTGLTSFTANGVLYASSTSALSTGSVLTFDGTTLVSGAHSISTGKFLINTTTARTNWLGSASPIAQIEGTTGATSAFSVTRNSNDVSGAYFNLSKSRGTTVNSTTILVADDVIGQLSFTGSDGVGMYYGAAVLGIVDSSPSTGSMPGRLVFSTAASGSTSLTERFRIGSSGQWGIGGATYGTAGQAFLSGGASAAPTWGTLGTGAGGTGLTSFTNAGVVYATSTSALTTSNELVYSGGSCNVQPNPATGGGSFRVVNTGGTLYSLIDNSVGLLTGVNYAAALWYSGNYPMLFAVNNAEQMRLTTTGLGIQMTAAYPLDVAGFARAGHVHRAGTYVAGTTTPSVAGISYMIIANTGATTITNFTNGIEGQVIYLKFNDSNTTVDRTNCFLAGGANFVSTSDDTLVLLKSGSYWYELSRSANS